MPKIITNKERIDRLTKELAKLKAEKDAEISELKKERRALKASKRYYVDRQEDKINIYSDMQNLINENKSLKEENEAIKKEATDNYNKGYQACYYRAKWKLEDAKKEYDKLIETTTKDLVESLFHFSTYESKENMKRFNNGERDMIDGDSFFNPFSLIISINPKNGRKLRQFDFWIIQEIFGNNLKYLEAANDFKAFKANNPNLSLDDILNYTYQKGMELLPYYKDYIV